MPSRIQLLCVLSILLITFTSPPACFANDEELPPLEPTLVDRAHKGISETLAAPSRWFDDFFQDPRIDQEPGGTLVRLRGSAIAEDGEKLGFKVKTKIRLKLPNLKKRFFLIFSSEEDDLRDGSLKNERTSNALAERSDTTLGLQYTQKRSTKLALTHRVGLNLENDFNPRARSRVRYSIPIADKSILSLTQAVTWEMDDGFGEETRIDYDIPISDKALIRSTGLGLFSEVSNGYEWLGMLQWLQSFSNKRALAVAGYIAGETRPQDHVTDYVAFLKYRQQAIKKWFFIELKPEVSWPRDEDFEPVGIFTLTFEIQFNG